MTRDEAIEAAGLALKFPCNNPGAQSIEARKFVDMAVALGILQLEEPKSGLQKLCSRLAGDFGWSHSEGRMMDIERALKEANLKIVEK